MTYRPGAPCPPDQRIQRQPPVAAWSSTPPRPQGNQKQATGTAPTPPTAKRLHTRGKSGSVVYTEDPPDVSPAPAEQARAAQPSPSDRAPSYYDGAAHPRDFRRQPMRPPRTVHHASNPAPPILNPHANKCHCLLFSLPHSHEVHHRPSAANMARIKELSTKHPKRNSARTPLPHAVSRRFGGDSTRPGSPYPSDMGVQMMPKAPRPQRHGQRLPHVRGPPALTDHTALPHSGHTPLTLPVRLYPHERQCMPSSSMPPFLRAK